VAAAGLILLASIPDIDFLPGYLVGNPRAYHWGPAHSLAAAVLAGAAAGLVASRFGRSFWRYFLLGGAACTSHLVLDMLLGPGGQSVGLEILWPFSTARFSAPWSVFLMLPRTVDQTGPLRALFSPVALPLMLRELAILGPVCLGAWWVRRLSAHANRAAVRPSPFTAPDPADCETS
jgi:membrane-bound metal-dependent hydrolase YbcI (DUF457 family)